MIYSIEVLSEVASSNLAVGYVVMRYFFRLCLRVASNSAFLEECTYEGAVQGSSDDMDLNLTSIGMGVGEGMWQLVTNVNIAL